jgi:hypothetical protein
VIFSRSGGGVFIISDHNQGGREGSESHFTS